MGKQSKAALSPSRPRLTVTDVLSKDFLPKPILAPLGKKAVQLNTPPCAIGNVFPRDAHTSSHGLVSSRVVSVCLLFNTFLI